MKQTADIDFTALAKECNHSLSQEKREWLNNRGISDGSIRRFCLGEVVTATALPSYLKGSVTIPYILQRSPLNVFTVRFRTFGLAKMKYVTLEGQRAHLYNLQPTIIKFAEPKIYLCEGEFDAIILEQLGFPAIAVPGASSFSGNWRFLFINHWQVSLVFDGDEAGHRGSNRVKSILGTVNQNVKQVWLPGVQDITDVYCSDGGPETLRRLLA